MFKKSVVFISFLLLVSCTKFIIYNDFEPEYKSYIMQCPTMGIASKISFLRFNKVVYDKEVMYVPIGLEFGKKYTFYSDSKIELELKLTNPNNNRIKIVHYVDENKKGVVRNNSFVLYEGKLPYKEFKIELPTYNDVEVDSWFEIYNADNVLMCQSGSANYKINYKENE